MEIAPLFPAEYPGVLWAPEWKDGFDHARHEWTLEAVRSMPLFGPLWAPGSLENDSSYPLLCPAKGCDAHNSLFGRLIWRNGRLFRSCVTAPGAVTQRTRRAIGADEA